MLLFQTKRTKQKFIGRSAILLCFFVLIIFLSLPWLANAGALNLQWSEKPSVFVRGQNTTFSGSVLGLSKQNSERLHLSFFLATSNKKYSLGSLKVKENGSFRLTARIPNSLPRGVSLRLKIIAWHPQTRVKNPSSHLDRSEQKNPSSTMNKGKTSKESAKGDPSKLKSKKSEKDLKSSKIKKNKLRSLKTSKSNQNKIKTQKTQGLKKKKTFPTPALPFAKKKLKASSFRTDTNDEELAKQAELKRDKAKAQKAEDERKRFALRKRKAEKLQKQLQQGWGPSPSMKDKESQKAKRKKKEKVEFLLPPIKPNRRLQDSSSLSRSKRVGIEQIKQAAEEAKEAAEQVKKAIKNASKTFQRSQLKYKKSKKKKTSKQQNINHPRKNETSQRNPLKENGPIGREFPRLNVKKKKRFDNRYPSSERKGSQFGERKGLNKRDSKRSEHGRTEQERGRKSKSNSDGPPVMLPSTNRRRQRKSGSVGSNGPSRLLSRSNQSALDLETGGGQIYLRQVFKPYMPQHQRITVFDKISGKYQLKVSSRRKRLIRIGGARSKSRSYFTGRLQVFLKSGLWTPIPSISPDARILWYRSRPRLELQFAKDIADVVYVRALRAYEGTISLKFGTDGAKFYFGNQIPKGVFVNQYPRGSKPRISRWIKRRVLYHLSEFGLSVKMDLRTLLMRLVPFYRGFAARSLVPREIQGDRYLTLMRARVGVCRHRATLFMVTMQSLGYPARFVGNGAHAFAEIQFPDGNWLRIDLGGGDIPNWVGQWRGKPFQPPSEPYPKVKTPKALGQKSRFPHPDPSFRNSKGQRSSGAFRWVRKSQAAEGTSLAERLLKKKMSNRFVRHAPLFLKKKK